MNWKKAQERAISGSWYFIVLTFFPYQLSIGMSLGIHEGLRLRVYFLCFKIAINLLKPKFLNYVTARKESLRRWLIKNNPKDRRG